MHIVRFELVTAKFIVHSSDGEQLAEELKELFNGTGIGIEWHSISTENVSYINLQEDKNETQKEIKKQIYSMEQ